MIDNELGLRKLSDSCRLKKSTLQKWGKKIMMLVYYSCFFLVVFTKVFFVTFFLYSQWGRTEDLHLLHFFTNPTLS